MENQKTNTQPVVSPAEAWYLATGQALERAMRIAEATLPDSGSEVVSEYRGQVLRQLSEAADDSWRQFVQHSDRPTTRLTRDAVIVEYDEARSLPMIRWPVEQGDSSWGILDLETLVGGESATIATPFRKVDLARLGEGHQVVQIRDRTHVATGALVEMLTTALRDAETAFVAADMQAGWRRQLQIISLYRQAASLAHHSLRPDEFSNWKALMPPLDDLGSASATICSYATSSRAMLAMAVHLVAQWLQACADGCEALPIDERSQVYRDRVGYSRDTLGLALDGMNRAVGKAHWKGDGRFDCMVVFRSEQYDIPVLALIPSVATPAPTLLAGKSRKTTQKV